MSGPPLKEASTDDLMHELRSRFGTGMIALAEKRVKDDHITQTLDWGNRFILIGVAEEMKIELLERRKTDLL